MVRRVKLFEPCYMEYKEYDKPVHYTEKFLKELASKVNKTNLVNEKHLSESIGEVTNFTFTNGALFGDVSTEQSLDNLKYSPYIDCSLQDDGDCWLAINPTGLKDVALTSTPRLPVTLPNTNDGGSTMSNENNSDNETIKILNGQVKDLNKELAIANNKLEANKDKLKKYNEMEKELEELRAWKADNEQVIEEQKPIIEAYNKELDAKKSNLIEKLSNGNEEVKTKLKDMDLAALETFDNLTVHEQPPQGIGANNAEGLNEGDGSENDKDANREAELKEVRSMFSELNNKEE